MKSIYFGLCILSCCFTCNCLFSQGAQSHEDHQNFKAKTTIEVLGNSENAVACPCGCGCKGPCECGCLSGLSCNCPR